MTDLSGVEITLIGFRGGHFSGFYVDRDRTSGPGWFVLGRNPAYGGSYVMVCARPDVPPRRVRLWNGKVRPGWRTRAEAQAVADEMNRRDRDSIPFLDLLGPLHGTQFPAPPHRPGDAP